MTLPNIIKKDTTYQLIIHLCEIILKKEKIDFRDTNYLSLKNACTEFYSKYEYIPPLVYKAQEALNKKIGYLKGETFYSFEEFSKNKVNADNLPCEFLVFFEYNYPIEIRSKSSLEFSSYPITLLSSVYDFCEENDFMIIPNSYFDGIFKERFENNEFAETVNKRYIDFIQLMRTTRKHENYVVCPFSASLLYYLIIYYKLDINEVWLPKKYLEFKNELFHQSYLIPLMCKKCVDLIDRITKRLDENLDLLANEIDSIKYNMNGYDLDKEAGDPEKELSSVEKRLNDNKELAAGEIAEIQSLNTLLEGSIFEEERQIPELQYLVISVNTETNPILKNQVVHIGPCFDEKMLKDSFSTKKLQGPKG